MSFFVVASRFSIFIIIVIISTRALFFISNHTK